MAACGTARWLGIVMAWAAVWVGVPMARAAEFRLRPQCVPAAAIVTLGDVAEVIARDAAEADALQNIELFPVPAAGTQRHLRLREVQDLLLLRGVSLIEHRFTGVSQVIVEGGQTARAEAEPTVTAATTRKATERVRDAILGHLRRHAAANEPWTVKVELTPAQVRAISEHAGALELGGGAPPWRAAQQFELTLNAAGRATRFVINADVAVKPSVVVVVRPLARGAIIGETDVELAQTAAGEPSDQLFYRIEEVVGRETTRTVSAGKPLTRDAVRAPLAVRRGEVVTVYACSPGIQVRTTGRAKDDGAHGELIAVESFHNRQSFLARVCGIREVEVFAHAPQIEAKTEQAPINLQSMPGIGAGPLPQTSSQAPSLSHSYTQGSVHARFDRP